MVEQNEPISAAEFGAALARLGAPRRFLIAVSGGPDSMALARLAAETGGEALAVTVDHGLREGSRAEAEQAGRWCRDAGLEHKILTWEGAKPAAGVQAAARAARYRLLAVFAEAERFEAILTGHTADDQAETTFMRLARGAGPKGAAAMAPATLIAAGPGDPVRLLRPLLEFRRARIAATLAARAQAAINDPSNDDPAFERIKIRALLGALEEQGLLTADALTRAAARAGAAARRLEAADAEAFNHARGCFFREGWASLSAAEAPASLIARLIHAVSGAAHAPAEAQSAGALAAVLANGAATLGGVGLKRRRDEIFIFRESAAVLGRAGVEPLASARIAARARLLWDGRFILENRAGAPVEIAPLGPAGAAALGSKRALYDAPPEALETLPAIKSDGGALAPVSADGGAIRARALTEERFFGRVVRFP